MESYVALLADIKKSRNYRTKEREDMQYLVAESLVYLNEFFQDGIEKPVMFSGGDEVQGLFRNPSPAFLYYRMLSFILGPDTLRGGFGFGNWDVRMDSEESTSQDGSAYHRARAAISAAKGSRLFDAVIATSRYPDAQLTTLMDHSLGIGKMRTDTQNETALIVELIYPLIESRCRLSHEQDDLLRRGARILSLRVRLFAAERKKKGMAREMLERVGDKGKLRFQERIPLDELRAYDEFYSFEDSMVGVSYSLASLTGMSRQGIDRQLSRGRVAQERNAVAFFAYAAEKAFRGGS